MRQAGPDFETTLPGGELEGLYSLETAGEALKLVARLFQYLSEVPAALTAREPASGGDELLLAQVVLLGNVCLRPAIKEKMTQIKLLWDGENMKITNVPEANQYLHREYRQGWSL